MSVLRQVTCRIWVPWPGVDPRALTVKAWVQATRLPGNSWVLYYLTQFQCCLLGRSVISDRFSTQSQKTALTLDANGKNRLPVFLNQMSINWKFPWPSLQFSHSVVFDSLQPHGLLHARPPCPSPTPRVYWNSCPLSQWCHPNISSSAVPFSSHLQSFPASGSFQMSQFFHQVAKILEFQHQYQSFQWICRTDLL